MRKTFKLTHPKIKYDRLVESARNEVNKYLKRERRKEIPEGYHYWDFDCKYGDTEADAKVIHLGDIKQHISEAQDKNLESFYLEILAKPAKRAARPTAIKNAEELKLKEAPKDEASTPGE